LEGGEVARVDDDESFIVADIEVEECSTCSTAKLLCEVLRNRGHTCVFDWNCVKEFETVYDTEGFAVFLEHAKSFRMIQ
jgi:hypothetical protein